MTTIRDLMLDMTREEFEALEKRLEANGVPLTVYVRRLRDRWTEEEAAETPIGERLKAVMGYTAEERELIRKRLEGTDISWRLYYNRVKHLGWTEERAMTEPPTKRAPRKPSIKENMSRNQIAELNKKLNENGIPWKTAAQRIKCGWSFEDAITIPVRVGSTTTYAFYEGEDIVAIGTVREIAETTGLRESSVRSYARDGRKKKLVKISDGWRDELEGNEHDADYEN